MSDELRLNEVQLPEGTKSICGKAVRFAFVSECDGARYVSAARIAALEAALAKADALTDQCELFADGKLYSMNPVLEAREAYREARKLDA